MSMTTTARTGHSATGALHDVIDPSDGSVIDSIPVSSEADCDAAVDTAARAFGPFARLAPRVRAEMLRTAYELMVEESEQLARLVSRENGKILADARAEVAYAAEFF
ncbi:MAG: succinate-semialdehyde dehydrogenase / glutarate-semialdehyde dehydrogenase, partial [Microbacteriaceae bacterium]|nr:succinate-semialdehyde dehydrogenase / glutarate-semialdehyde dehydrogenase [Microbacteriaceae bacterium]